MELGLRLAQTFSDGKAYLEAYIAHLKRFYPLAHFQFVDEKVDAFQWEYCKRMHGFLLLIPYSVDISEPMVFLTWAFSHERLAWDLAGSGVGQQYTEIRANLEAIFTRFLPRVTMLTATPIATVENRFARENDVVRHIGLVYACAVANIREFQEDNPDLRGLFLPIKEVPNLFLADSWNREVILYACKRIPELLTGARAVEREVEEQHSLRTRYMIHRRITKPLLRLSDQLLSFLMRRVPRKQLASIVFDAVPDNIETLLDVSAGDHQSSINFGKKAKIVVLNDVVWSTLNVLVNEAISATDIHADFVFVNEDILRAPFCSQSFDVVYCRNTLHHLSSVAEIISLLHRLQRWSRNTVIIEEVLNPRESMAPWDWLRDQYYCQFLGDVGEALLSSNQLEALFNSTFPKQEWEYSLVRHNTVRGKISLFIAQRVRERQSSLAPSENFLSKSEAQ